MDFDTTIHGMVAPGYESVAEAFASTVSESGGSALAVRVDGLTVLDLWHGAADRERAVPWQHDTMAMVFSCTKGLLAIMIGHLVQEGRLELDLPVATYWPEFAAAGKSAITVRQALSHRAGLATLRDDVDLGAALDDAAMAARLAEEAPLWSPDAAYGYHALTYGWLAGEIIRRVTGETPGARLRRTLAGPLAADAWIGVPEPDLPRVARLAAGDSLSAPPPMTTERAIDPEDARWMERAMTLGTAFPASFVVPGEGFDDPRVRQAGVPGAGGAASAAGLAAIWSATVVPVSGVEPLDAAVVADMTRVQSEGEPVWWLPGPYPRWGTGFMLPSERRPFLSDASFGHDGAGGQIAFADSRHRVGFGYVTSLLEVHSDDRGDSIVRALGRVLGAPPRRDFEVAAEENGRS
ncbi:MAG: beta-lactamase family protein [Microbacterium sp.]|uniref:serine hydrolase domain-containing protein n=1 Tax=Microbacterium sp. TaxID=51671 RepID=UPI001AC903BC|nr:serine hydrolase domain-containing protein [Microbacterium sp.]MBN9178845.1 beta-lactamase family protein [Microbacterium sp.]